MLIFARAVARDPEPRGKADAGCAVGLIVFHIAGTLADIQPAFAAENVVQIRFGHAQADHRQRMALFKQIRGHGFFALQQRIRYGNGPHHRGFGKADRFGVLLGFRGGRGAVGGIVDDGIGHAGGDGKRKRIGAITALRAEHGGRAITGVTAGAVLLAGRRRGENQFAGIGAAAGKAGAQHGKSEAIQQNALRRGKKQRVDLFDTIGTLIGCAASGNMLDKEYKLPGIKGALLADAIGTTVGAICGTSTVTTFVESASGISVGGRTGLTSVVAAFMFLISLFLTPFFLTIPAFAITPALVIVGFLMVRQVVHINFEHLTDAIPAFLGIIAMPFFYSISEGISFSIISYTFIHLLCGERAKIHPLLYILTILFIFKYALI